MPRLRRNMLPQFLLLLLFAWVSAPLAFNLIGTEFASGLLTGILLWANIVGVTILLIAGVSALFFRAKLPLIVCAAALLCLPLYVYLTLPGAFQWLVPGSYSAPAPTIFMWNADAVAGITLLLVVSYLHLRPPGSERPPKYS